MAVRTRYDNWSFYYSPTCHMYQNVRRGTVFDGDLGVYLQTTAADAVEVVDLTPPTAPPTAPLVAVEAPSLPVLDDADPGEPETVGAFDPSAHNGPAVIAYAAEHPDERAAILAAERAGKQRTTVLAALA